MMVPITGRCRIALQPLAHRRRAHAERRDDCGRHQPTTRASAPESAPGAQAATTAAPAARSERVDSARRVYRAAYMRLLTRQSSGSGLDFSGAAARRQASRSIAASAAICSRIDVKPAALAPCSGHAKAHRAGEQRHQGHQLQQPGHAKTAVGRHCPQAAARTLATRDRGRRTPSRRPRQAPTGASAAPPARTPLAKTDRHRPRPQSCSWAAHPPPPCPYRNDCKGL